MEKTQLKTIVGENIKDLRIAAGHSRSSFSLMVGISRQYLINIETGRANATVDVLEKVANGLAVPVVQLFEDKHNPTSISLEKKEPVAAQEAQPKWPTIRRPPNNGLNRIPATPRKF